MKCKIVCPHGCKKKISRAEWNEHEQECPEKIVPCIACAFVNSLCPIFSSNSRVWDVSCPEHQPFYFFSFNLVEAMSAVPSVALAKTFTNTAVPSKAYALSFRSLPSLSFLVLPILTLLILFLLVLPAPRFYFFSLLSLLSFRSFPLLPTSPSSDPFYSPICIPFLVFSSSSLLRLRRSFHECDSTAFFDLFN